MGEKKKKSDTTLANFDKRIVERNVTKGRLSRTDFEQHMKSLPDLESQADNIADKVYPGERPN